MEEILILAIIFNVILVLIAYFSSSRPVMVVSSLVWILIGFALFQSYNGTEDIDKTYLTLLIAITYLIAFAQAFMPLRNKAA